MSKGKRLKISSFKSVYLREERDEALFDAYTRAIRENDFRSQEEAIDYVRLHDAPRFYIEGAYCRAIISEMKRGNPMRMKGGPQVEKFKELYRRFEEASKLPENEGLPVGAICDNIVEEPAPQFYLSNRSVRAIISKQREKRCKEKIGR